MNLLEMKMNGLDNLIIHYHTRFIKHGLFNSKFFYVSNPYLNLDTLVQEKVNLAHKIERYMNVILKIPIPNNPYKFQLLHLSGL